MAIRINPQPLWGGNWQFGWALDYHTTFSRRLPSGDFETGRTKLGELLYRLKYRHDRQVIGPIAEAVADFLRPLSITPTLSAIIPVPPSDTSRPFQPVHELAVAIGRRVGLPVLADILVKVKDTRALKNVDDPTERHQLLRDAFQVDDLLFRGKSVLLFDDLYRSGATLKEITRTLHRQGGAARVYVLVVTKTRTRR